MFNSKNYNYESKVIAITKEIEKSITPDKVVEMYDVIKEEVEKNIIKKLRIESNLLKGVAILKKDIDTQTKTISTHFNLNETDYFRDYIIRDDCIVAEGSDLIVEKLKKHYSDIVGVELIKETFKTIQLKK